MFDFKDTIAIGGDHAGYKLKQFLIDHLKKEGYQFKDYGTISESSVDYPDVIHPLAKDINDGIIKMGVILCGSGNGVAITANKYLNVRAAICWNEEIVKFARLHNDANVIALPARFISQEEALKFVRLFITTGFEGGRHQQRVEKISKVL
jgi:ribose 5-phosphate isomerase B